MKRFFLFGWITVLCVAAHAQSVSYSFVTQDPDLYKRTQVYVDVFSGDTYLGPSIGGGLKGETVIGDRIMPWAEIKYSYLDANTHHVVSGYPTNAGGQKKQTVIDIGGAFFLADKQRKRKVKVVLSSYSDGRYRHTRYLMVPAYVKKLFGVEGGIYANRRALEFETKSHKYFHYKSTDGQYDVPIAEVAGASGIQPSGEYYQPLSMTHVFSVYGGIHYRKVVNVTISSGSYGTCSHRSVSDLYLDVMFAGAVPIENVIDTKGKEWIISPQSGAIRHVGWKAGFTFHNSRKTSIHYNAEFGQKPGPVMGDDMFSSGGYISVSMGFNIGFNTRLDIKHKAANNDKEAAGK